MYYVYTRLLYSPFFILLTASGVQVRSCSKVYSGVTPANQARWAHTGKKAHDMCYVYVYVYAHALGPTVTRRLRACTYSMCMRASPQAGYLQSQTSRRHHQRRTLQGHHNRPHGLLKNVHDTRAPEWHLSMYLSWQRQEGFESSQYFHALGKDAR